MRSTIWDVLAPWAPLGADVVLKATVALLLAFGLAAVLRRATAAARHVVWAVVMSALLLLPVGLAVIPWRLPVLPVPALSAAEQLRADRSVAPAAREGLRPIAAAAVPGARGRTEITASGGHPPGAAQRQPRQAASGGASPRTPSVDPSALPVGEPGAAGVAGVAGVAGAAVLLWLAVAGLLLARLVGDVVAAHRLRRRARRITDPAWSAQLRWMSLRLDVRRPVSLLWSDRVRVPVTCGVIRPAIVLPAGSDSWDEDRRRAVLLHELAHIRRRDLLVQLVAQAARAIYWFHPLAWSAVRRLRQESERAADDVVLAAGARASAYANHLLQIVRSAGAGVAPAAALPMAQRSDFEGRLLAILEPRQRRAGPGRGRLALLVAGMVLVMLPLLAAAPAGSVAAEPTEVTGAAVQPSAGLAGEEDPTPSQRSGAEAETGASAESGPERPDRTAETAIPDPATGPDRDPSAERTGAIAQEPAAAADAVSAALTDALADQDRGVRRSAARALGERQDTAAIAALAQAVRTDPDTEVRRMAAWALGEMEDVRGVPALADALRDEDAEVRQRAAWALGEIEHPDAVPALIVAVDDASAEVRETAVWALGEIEHPDAVPVLARFIDDPSPEVRQKAVWALGEIQSPDALPSLVRAAGDESAEVREKAVWAIGELQPNGLPDAVLSAMRDPAVEVRRMAAWAAGEIEDPAATDGLTALLQDESREVARTALWALGEIGDGPALDVLLELLQSEDPQIRRAAAEALGRRHDR